MQNGDSPGPAAPPQPNPTDRDPKDQKTPQAYAGTYNTNTNLNYIQYKGDYKYNIALNSVKIYYLTHITTFLFWFAPYLRFQFS